MWIAAGAAAWAAVFLMDAAPTGTPWIDAVERAAFVVVMVVAGARARRWTLVLGAGLVAATSSGLPQFGAVAALAFALYLVAVNRRGRVLDSVIAALIGLGALGLDVGGPVGLEVVIAAVATVPIAWSAYGYTTRRAQRRWKRGLLALCAAAIIATGLSAVAAATSLTAVQSGVDATRDGVALTSEGDRDSATKQFDDAAGSFAAAEGRVGAWWASAARAVPVVGHNVRAVQESVVLGVRLTRSARALSADVDFDSVQRADGGVDLETLSAFEPAIRQVATVSAQAGEVLADVESPWMARPLAERVDELSAEVADIGRQSELALLGVTDGPALLGADGARRYLVLLGNPAELRDLGGHLGNWAELVVDEGRIELADVGGPTDLSVDPATAPEPTVSAIPASMMALQPMRFPQNWGGDPDMRTVTRIASANFEQVTGRAIDGVIYADTATFAALIELTGPVAVPDLPEPFQLTAQNAEEFLARDQFLRFERASVGDAALQTVIENVFQRLSTSELPSPRSVGELFGPLVAAGHLNVSTLHAEDQQLLSRLGTTAEVPPAGGGDVLSVIQRNAGPSKIDSYLSRTTNVDVRWNPQTGDVASIVDVRLRNDAPAEGLNELVLGNGVGAPYGTNVSDLSILTPFPLMSVLVDGVSVGAQPLYEDGYWRHTVRVRVPPGGTTDVRFRLAGEVEAGPDYSMTFLGQPIMGENTLSVAVSPSTGVVMNGDESSTMSNKSIRKLDAGGDYVFTWSSGKR